MWNVLFAAFKSQFSSVKMAAITNCIMEITQHLEEDYVKDGNARDAAIDGICEILQQHKMKK